MVLCYIQMPSKLEVFLNLKYLNNSILKYNSIWISLPNVLTQFKTLSHLDLSFHPPPCPQNPYHVPLPHSSPKSLLSGVASAPFRPLIFAQAVSLCACPVPSCTWRRPMRPSGPRSLVCVSMKSPLLPRQFVVPSSVST